ncbi:hypothetical protein QW71_13160 [Paenibacillus sp. IHB B 3415]|uniref:hypothetical protein n=1 Tax=Paenibacillus sp. IHB B 3415 TaxID=867080 RepID=UPI000574F90B|nr:hypothetical protein [Paenibacillus sp. IHB B 3415]KHL95399.1 hypothetical protein QW71_13160 [Paenibacillus sp. IHB B 3415]
MTSDAGRSLIEITYNLSKDDLMDAKKIEPFYKMFGVFNLKDSKMTTLVLASARTISRHGGNLSRSELDDILDYIQKSIRKKVIDCLIKYEWIQFNGIDYQMPGRIVSLLTHGLFGSVIRGEMNFAEEIMLVGNEAEISGLYNLDQEILEKNFIIHMSQLKDIRDKIERMIQRRSKKEIREIIQTSPTILNAIEELRKKIRRSDLSNSFQKRNGFYEVCGQITALVAQTINIARENLLQDVGSLGKYVDSERIEEFIKGASGEYLANVAIRYFSAPKQNPQLREETIVYKTKSFFLQEYNELIVVPPPPVIDFEEEEIIFETRENPLDLLYHELIYKLQGKQYAPLEEVLFDESDSFGLAMYRTGQTIKLVSNLQESETIKEDNLGLDIKDSMKLLKKGSIKEMTEVYIRRENHGGNN